MNKIEFYFEKDSYKIFKKKLEKTLKKTLSFLKKDKVFLFVYLVSEKKIRELNNFYRKKNKSTNVLALEIKEKFFIEKNFLYLGDIFLAPDFIKKEKQDLNYLAIHALLHLLGYTHKKNSDTIKMKKLEDEILEKI